MAVSAFAAYGQSQLLWLNACLIPVLLFGKRNILTLFLAFLAAITSYYFISISIPKKAEYRSDTISFVWSDSVKIDGGKVKGFARTTAGDRVYVTYNFQNEQEKVRFLRAHIPLYIFTGRGSYTEPIPASHPYSFDMQRYLRMNGAADIFDVDQIIESRSAKGPLVKLSEWRYRAKMHIQTAFPVPLQTEAEALLIGDRSGMDDELSAAYRTLGITHLFAISGLHVGLMTFLIRHLLIRLSVREETVDTLLIVLLPCYAVLAGGAPSVWRAVSVTVLLLLTASGRLKIRMDDALAASAALFILLTPHVIFQPGFQLSYAAAISLVYSSGILLQGKTAWVTSFLVNSITQIALYPILLYHFYEISISSFLVNLFYVPLYSVVILPMNILLFVTSLAVPPIATLLFAFYTPLRLGIGSITMYAAGLPFQLWAPGRPDPLLACIAVVCILLFFIAMEKKWHWKKSVVLIIFPVLLIQWKPYLDPVSKITFLDVGQGDSIVLQLPYRRAVYVIDTGGTVSFGDPTWKTPDKSFEVGRNIVVPYLKGQGITKVDKLILTHADSDHIEGADELIEELKVKEIHIPPGSEWEQTMVPIIGMALDRRIPIVSASERTEWAKGRIHFEYLSPEKGRYKGNDSSLVLLLKTEELAFLFTGDMEVEGEEQFIRKYRERDFGRVVLKAGHHGSRTSSTDEFISLLSPETAIISAGRNNRYGHPHPEVLATFHTYGVAVLSTAEKGSITVTVRGGDYVISAMH